MQSLLASGNDYVLFIGRSCLAAVFGISALSKFRRDPAEIKVLANLHIPAPASAEVLVGVCEVIGAVRWCWASMPKLLQFCWRSS